MFLLFLCFQKKFFVIYKSVKRTIQKILLFKSKSVVGTVGFTCRGLFSPEQKLFLLTVLSLTHHSFYPAYFGPRNLPRASALHFLYFLSRKKQFRWLLLLYFSREEHQNAAKWQTNRCSNIHCAASTCWVKEN